MKSKCKNCVHHSWTIEGDAWCDKQMQYTNEDGCCNSYRNEGKETLMVLLAVAIICSLLALAVNCGA